MSLLLATGAVLLAVHPVEDLVADWGLGDRAVPVEGAHVDGRCSVHGGVLTDCDATLTAPGTGGTQISRKVHYFFVDFHTGSYQVQVYADPAKPEILTTDLALEKRLNRLVTLAVGGPMFAGLAVMVLVLASKDLREKRATRRALSRKVLRPHLLHISHYAVGQWGVMPFPFGPTSIGRTWELPRGARPIVMDPDRKLILGVTAGDGAVVMPLDNRLRWIGLDAEERRKLLEDLGPDRLGRWLAALTSAATDAEQKRLRRGARILVVIGLVLAALSGAAAWVAFGERDSGVGEIVTLVRGDEAPQGRTVRLDGIRQAKHAARTTRTENGAANLEEWVPVTAPDWKRGQPVTWIVNDPQYGMGRGEAVKWSGTVSQEPLPDRARDALTKYGLVLASPVRVLDAFPPAANPYYEPALAVMAICGAIAVGLLLGALIVRIKAGRLEGLKR